MKRSALFFSLMISLSANADVYNFSEEDIITGKEKTWLQVDPVAVSNDEGLMNVICTKKDISVYVNIGVQFHGDVIMKTSYKIGNNPPVRNDVWLWNYQSYASYRGEPYATRIVEQLLDEKLMYVRFQTGEDATFSLKGGEVEINKFISNCSKLNKKFAEEFAGYQASAKQ